MISYRQADLLKKVDEDKRLVRLTLVIYNGPEGDSVDSKISTTRVSAFMQHLLVTIMANLERSWTVNSVGEVDVDSNKYAMPVPARERNIYKNTLDAVGNTLNSMAPYYYKGKLSGGVLPSGAVYATYKIMDAKFPAGSEVKFKYFGTEFDGVVQAIRGDGSYEVSVVKSQEADLADHNMSNPVVLNEAENWLEPR
jgi:hypothetical protein